MPLCLHCNAPNDDDAAYCHACGKSLSQQNINLGDIGLFKGNVSVDAGHGDATVQIGDVGMIGEVHVGLGREELEEILTTVTGLFVDSTNAAKGASNLIDGQYELREIIGRGGMGIVWKAWDTRLETEVAVKLLPDAIAQDPTSVLQLRNEGLRLVKLPPHQNIVRVHNVSSPGQPIAYVAMELLSGPTLEQYLVVRGPMEEEALVPIADKVCDAIEHAHSQDPPLIHRDIKPGNIIVTTDGVPKVLDFGTAELARHRTITHLSVHAGADSSAMKHAERVKAGTLSYMAPELQERREATPASDQYALACTFYECLSGFPPFTGVDLLAQHRERPPQPIHGVSDRANDALLRALAKRPEDRFATVAGLALAMSPRGPGPGAMTPEMLRAMIVGLRGDGPIAGVESGSLSTIGGVLEQLLGQVPDDPQAAAQLGEVRDELDRRAEIDALRKSASDARDASMWPETMEACRRLLELDPDDQDAVSWLAGAKLRQQEHDRELEHQSEVARAYHAADEALRRSDGLGALGSIDRLEKLEPGDERLQTLRERLDAIVSAEVSANPPAPVELPPPVGWARRRRPVFVALFVAMAGAVLIWQYGTPFVPSEQATPEPSRATESRLRIDSLTLAVEDLRWPTHHLPDDLPMDMLVWMKLGDPIERVSNAAGEDSGVVRAGPYVQEHAANLGRGRLRAFGFGAAELREGSSGTEIRPMFLPPIAPGDGEPSRELVVWALRSALLDAYTVLARRSVNHTGGSWNLRESSSGGMTLGNYSVATQLQTPSILHRSRGGVILGDYFVRQTAPFPAHEIGSSWYQVQSDGSVLAYQEVVMQIEERQGPRGTVDSRPSGSTPPEAPPE